MISLDISARRQHPARSVINRSHAVASQIGICSSLQARLIGFAFWNRSFRFLHGLWRAPLFFRRKVGAQTWRHIPRLALKTKALKQPAEPVAKNAVSLTVERKVSNRVGFHSLAHDCKHGRTPDQLLLAFAQAGLAAKIIANVCAKVAKPARRLAAAVKTVNAK
jgi:hypothetical protein